MCSVAARGFTLLEVMLAILLLALLLAGTYGAIRTAVHAMHSGELAIDRMNRLRVAQEFVRRQVSRIMPLAFAQDESTNTNFVFEGRGDFMRFVAPMPGYLSKGGPYVQTLSFVGSRNGGRQLLFTDTMLNGFDPDAKNDNEPSVLLDQIADGRFQYRTLDDQGELTDWSEQWDDPSVTPVMVRVLVRMLPEAQIEFPVMEIPLMLDVGAMRQNRPGQVLQGVGLRSGSSSRLGGNR
ncbi:MAG TPA: prepilin-type N-terminal cleavage/methylation domain-containing protein [Dokdonella sp.]